MMGSRQLALAVPVLTLLLLSLSRPSLSSDPRATQAAMICSNRTTTGATQRQVYIANFLSAMDAITPAIAKHRYGAVANGTGNQTVYVLGQCMEDLDGTDCNLCIARCKTGILSCLPFQRATRAGRLFYDGCYLRYDDYNFFNESLSSLDKTVCSTQETASSNSTLFRRNVKQLVRNLSSLAPNNHGFYAGSFGNGNETAYALAQCWEVLNVSSCATCLDNAASNVTSCVPKQEGRVLNAGCYLRYSDHKFYNNSGSASNGGSSRVGLVLAVTSSVVAVVLFAATTLYFVNKRIARKRRARVEFGDLLAAVNQSKLYFSYESLEKATNYFNHSNKLGQGGSGSVYKGTLSDGKVVAVKRLLFNTRQWVDHFFNEVNLISGIEHKNLVKLLGCSVTGPESLLVYEYVPNQSLQDYLFGTRDVPVQPLTWDMRYKIILGTAEGLAYLNEESEFRIIHRDIKLSNVLLDEDFTAKIADFGLARLFPHDQTHVSTAIAGTLGYMAPEYIVRGHLTEKADVYSFGVLLIEVVTGRRNNSFNQNSCSILQTVWDLYKRGRQSEAVDPALDRNFEEEEVSRLLRIGLLCVQASADLRPAMSTVVKMLAENYDIPEPTQPPFLNPMSLAESSVSAGPPGHGSRAKSSSQSSKNSMTESFIEPR